MEEIRKLARENILALDPYKSARSIYKDQGKSMLDANENPYGTYGRYPDSSQNKLKGLLSEIKNIDASRIFLGNGSDEIIDLLIRVFCVPGIDSIVCFKPGFGMYEVCAKINDVNVTNINLNQAFDIDESIIKRVIAERAKVLFLCSPNNPTGNSLNPESISTLLQDFPGIVVIDEAYIDFSKSQDSYIKHLDEYPRLVVLQTLSKGMGMAGLRIGALYADEYVVDLLNKIKPPYNISTANQKIALGLLEDTRGRQEDINKILREKSRLMAFLESFSPMVKLFPSDSNFFLISCPFAKSIYDSLKAEGIIIRDQSHQVKDTLRVSVGTPEENDLFMKTFKKIVDAESIVLR